MRLPGNVFDVLPQELIVSVFVGSIFKESFLASANEFFCFIAPDFKIFPVMLLISSVSHADLLTRLTRFSLIGTCLLRTDMNSAFYAEKFIFE